VIKVAALRSLGRLRQIVALMGLCRHSETHQFPFRGSLHQQTAPNISSLLSITGPHHGCTGLWHHVLDFFPAQDRPQQ